MIESNWLACSNPYILLKWLVRKPRARKLRLFAVACCRHLTAIPRDDRLRRALDFAEAVADGKASEVEWPLVINAAWQAAVRRRGLKLDKRQMADEAAAHAVNQNLRNMVMAVQPRAASAAPVQQEEETWQANVLRDIFGNPFRQVTLHPAWLRWNDATIPRLAQQMYDSRDFASMPILADALEEAGCTSGDMLNHCRPPSVHVRGCWVVDLLLGKT